MNKEQREQYEAEQRRAFWQSVEQRVDGLINEIGLSGEERDKLRQSILATVDDTNREFARMILGFVENDLALERDPVVEWIETQAHRFKSWWSGKAA